MADEQAKPILFSGPMVRAILDGRKSQTRRVLKPQPFGDSYHDGPVGGRYVPRPASNLRPYASFAAIAVGGGAVRTETVGVAYEPGDRLWVREAHALDGERCWYREGHAEAAVKGPRVDVRWRPSIHMPRRFSRITLEVTDVKVERLQEISDTDAEAEGVFRHVAEHSLDKVFRGERGATAIRYFRDLWTSINGPGSWEANPWVVAISFKRL